MTDNITLDIIKNIQNSLADLKKGQSDLRTDINLQFTALSEKLSGQLLSEIEMRHELQVLRERLDKVESRLELS